MADGLCTGDPGGNVVEKTLMENYDNEMLCETNDCVNDCIVSENVKSFSIKANSDCSDKLFDVSLCVATAANTSATTTTTTTTSTKNCSNNNTNTNTASKSNLVVDKTTEGSIVHGEEVVVDNVKQKGNSKKFMSKSLATTDSSNIDEEDDCRKKRCVDRYDSSESSDSGVAVLSCTDCSGSSTASSDITDPGSPFSTASSHSEDSAASQPTKMPPTQTAHHPPWPWMNASAPVAAAATEDGGDDGAAAKKPEVNHHLSPLKRTASNSETDITEDDEDNKTAAAFPEIKRMKSISEDSSNMESSSDNSNQSPTCLNNLSSSLNKNNNSSGAATRKLSDISATITTTSPNNDKLVNNNNNNINKLKVPKDTFVAVAASKQLQQGKITEYFKSQIKSNGIKANLAKKKIVKSLLVDQQTQFNSLKACVRNNNVKGLNPVLKKLTSEAVTSAKAQKSRKLSPVSVPRKILPAPSKISEKITLNNHLHHHQLNNLTNFAPAVTLTAVSFPPNMTYLHTKAPKPPDNPAAAASIFVPQFAAIANDHKINAIPATIINRATTQCLNVMQPVQKITTINNFNCVKLNGTVVPIVKLNTLPSRLNGANLANVQPPPVPPQPQLPHNHQQLSVETALPTVLCAKPKEYSNHIPSSIKPVANMVVPQVQVTTLITPSNNNMPSLASAVVQSRCSRQESQEKSRTADDADTVQNHMDKCVPDEKSTIPPSPTDTSSDSGVSTSNKDCFLQINICDEGKVKEQKSPILSQPKTIRFPAKQPEIREDSKDAKSTTSTDGMCRWKDCKTHFDTSGALLEHLQVKHVISQANQEKFVCLWLGCKVHGRKSCSRTWLERHVLAHAGTKPFRCIVDGCGQRFNSQLMLERHVNGHFNTDGSQNNSAKKSTESGPLKLFKRNGKRIRFRRQPWSARMFDFIDGGIMEGLQHKLLIMTQKRTLGNIGNAGDTIHLKSQVLAKRIEPDGSTKFLLKWHPVDVIPDEWVTESEYKPTKTVSIPKLTPASKDVLIPNLFPSSSGSEQVRRKHRRKPAVSKLNTNNKNCNNNKT